MELLNIGGSFYNHTPSLNSFLYALAGKAQMYCTGNYGINNQIAGNNGDVVVRLGDIEESSTTYMIFDFGQYSAAASSIGQRTNANYIPGVGEALHLSESDCPVYSNAFYDKFQKDCMSGRHLGGINMAFADGHVKWLTAATVQAEAIKSNYGNFGL